MKFFYTLIGIMQFSIAAFAQPITINASDIPIPSYPFNIDEITSALPVNPTMGVNQVWDYSTYFGNTPQVNNYQAESETFFLNAGVDVNLAGSKELNSTAGYLITNEYDFNVNGVYESGANINHQAYELSAVTGSNMDSLIFPAQQYIFSSPKILMEFPFTANSAWHSVSSRVTDFNLTVAAYFLNNTPGQQKYTYYRNDSIVGWGTLSVYTTSGPSAPIEVLMEQVEQYSVDSFFLSGSPAPTPLLTAFQVTQGQRTNVQYSYNFYRAGSFNYLLRLNYGSDDTYTSLASAFVSTDDLTDVNNPEGNSYSTIVFPNPSDGAEVNIKVIGHSFDLNEYSIINLSGKIVQKGSVKNKSNGLTQLSLDAKLANGNYFVKVKDMSNKEVVSQQISLQR